MARRTGADALEVMGIATAAAIPLYAVLHQLGALRSPASLAAVVFVALLGATLWARGIEGRPLAAVAVTAFGAVYTGGLLSFAYLLRHHRFVATDLGGSALVLYPVFLTWASDVGAYFVGRAVGKAKLMPSVSPGKTQAGAVGAILVSAMASVLYVQFALRPAAQLALSPGLAVVFGVVVSLVAQVGDLFESMLKREAGVKDSSRLLPGHGGILDRLDSLYFVLPVAHLLLTRLLVPVPQ